MKELLSKKTQEVCKIIFPYFKVEGGGSSNLSEAMEYSLKAGGKRLRPMLMRESAILFGAEPESLPVFMAAIEMIHNYSLVHDDLPAMDNDLLRHGKPSTHAKYGEADAILCGDGLLNLAFEVVSEYAFLNPSDRVLKAVRTLAKASGSQGMVGGQALDVKYDKTGDKPSLEELLYIYENKTGQLIRTSLTIGAILAGASEIEEEKLDKIGANIGFAFQIQDDILDIVGDEVVLGKPIGSDEKNQKYTYVSMVGMDEAKKKVDSLTKEAIDCLMSLPGDKTFLRDLFLYLVKRDM